MRNTHSIEKLLILLSVFLLSGCYKIMDYWPSQPPAHYRIKSVTFHEEYYGTYQGNFYYNRSGDPDSVIYGYVGTAFPNLYFSYNSKKQVSEIKAFYTNDGFDSWHRLGYNQKGLITTDTLYTWGVKYQDPNHQIIMIRSLSILNMTITIELPKQHTIGYILPYLLRLS